MALPEILSVLLRLAELAFAAIVAGLTGSYLHAARGASAWSLGRLIYTEVVAGLSIFFALVWLLPFSGSFIHWPADLFFSVLWFVAFGLLVDWLGGSCGDVFDWDGIAVRYGDAAGSCSRLKADLAFVFLSAIMWLVSALVGIYWVRRHTRVAPAPTYRRRWYRSRV